MKHLLYLMSALLLVACGSKSDTATEQQQDLGPEWVVKGTVPQDRLNGWRVFIVPVDPKSATFTNKHFEDSIGVDSVFVENGQFEFRGHGEFLARLTMDKHVRMGTQDLLIVTEPGKTVYVTIDSLSSGGGTPQNEALQQWKVMKHAHDAIAGPKTQELYFLHHTGDTVAEQALRDSLRAFNRDFANRVLDLADVLGRGPAYDVFTSHYSRE